MARPRALTRSSRRYLQPAILIKHVVLILSISRGEMAVFQRFDDRFCHLSRHLAVLTFGAPIAFSSRQTAHLEAKSRRSFHGGGQQVEGAHGACRYGSHDKTDRTEAIYFVRLIEAHRSWRAGETSASRSLPMGKKMR